MLRISNYMKLMFYFFYKYFFFYFSKFLLRAVNNGWRTSSGTRTTVRQTMF